MRIDWSPHHSALGLLWRLFATAEGDEEQDADDDGAEDVFGAAVVADERKSHHDESQGVAIGAGAKPPAPIPELHQHTVARGLEGGGRSQCRRRRQ